MSYNVSIEELDGMKFYDYFMAGASKIIENQSDLNKINVFPVPDSDTGTNIALTMKYVLDNTTPNISFNKTAQLIAENALIGARGNSGVIFAQYLYGLSREAGVHHKIGISHFAQIMKNAVEYVYEAIAKPVEGTIITVIREWADSLYEAKEKASNFLHLISDSYRIAQISLNETPEKLEVLKKAKVVDAGAKGFVYFLEGILDFIKTGKHTEHAQNFKDIVNIEEIGESDFGDLTYRYCTETMIEGENIDKKAVNERIRNMGDSIVVAGSDKKLRIHIHTNDPPEFFNGILDFGTLAYQKVDDMLRQYEIVHKRKSKIAILTDSACDLPSVLMDNYQINMVPINLYVGLNHYLDKLSITPELFYNRLDSVKPYPTTAQPNVKQYAPFYERLAKHYKQIISIHLSDKLSGTYANSKKTADMIKENHDVDITVIDSKTISGALGLLVLRVARAVEDGMSYEDIVSNIGEWQNKNRLLVSVKTMKYLVRGGRVSAMKGLVAKILNLKPIVSLDEEGKTVVFDKAFSQKGNIKRVFKHVEEINKNSEIWEYCILHAHNIDGAVDYANRMEKLLGMKPAYIQDISTVIGLNAGIGAVAIALMEK
jgi:hypothetical protein